VLFPGTFTCVALAQDNATRRSQSDRTITVEISLFSTVSLPTITSPHHDIPIHQTTIQ
jgi:hypothetical protein